MYLLASSSPTGEYKGALGKSARDYPQGPHCYSQPCFKPPGPALHVSITHSSGDHSCQGCLLGTWKQVHLNITN